MPCFALRAKATGAKNESKNDDSKSSLEKLRASCLEGSENFGCSFGFTNFVAEA